MPISITTNDLDACYKAGMFYLAENKNGGQPILKSVDGYEALFRCFISCAPCVYTDSIRDRVMSYAKANGYRRQKNLKRAVKRGRVDPSFDNGARLGVELKKLSAYVPQPKLDAIIESANRKFSEAFPVH